MKLPIKDEAAFAGPLRHLRRRHPSAHMTQDLKFQKTASIPQWRSAALRSARRNFSPHFPAQGSLSS